MEGRIIDQSTALLKISSYFCTLIINSYILTCLMRNHDIIVGQLNVLEITFLLLSILTFTGEPDDNSISNPLIKNYKLFNIHFYVQIIGLFLFKLLTVYFACRTYKTNREMDIIKIHR